VAHSDPQPLTGLDAGRGLCHDTASPASTDRVALRLRLNEGDHPGPVDGAWWPQSPDLDAEVMDLVDNFPDRSGKVLSILYSRPDWDAAPGAPATEQIQTRQGPVEIASYPSDDTHLLILKMQTGRRHRLLVVPSDTAPDVAARIMDQAMDDRDTRGPAALLGLGGPDQSHIGLDSWNH
jgi:hypothetical protein